MAEPANPPADAKAGVFDLGEGLTPVDVWQGLHASVPLWIASAGKEAGQINRDRIDRGDLVLLKALATFPAQRWVSICDGIGWTTYGAIASSWCQCAHLEGVLVLWRKALNGQKPGELELRPARFLNPDFLPAPKLSAIVEAGEDMPGAWLLLAAFRGSGVEVECDLPANKLADLNKDLAKLL